MSFKTPPNSSISVPCSPSPMVTAESLPQLDSSAMDKAVLKNRLKGSSVGVVLKCVGGTEVESIDMYISVGRKIGVTRCLGV